MSYRDAEGDPELWVMDADGSNQVQLTDNDVPDYEHDWSADGNHIIFTSFRDGLFNIYMMDADGSNEVQITDDELEQHNPIWQP